MSEIKGQLLGIILTLIVFGAISIVLANVYSSSATKVSLFSEHIETGAVDEIGFSVPNGAVVRNDAVAFTGLSY